MDFEEEVDMISRDNGGDGGDPYMVVVGKMIGFDELV